MKREKSCGGIIYNEDNEFLIIQNRGGKHWDFPKGHAEKGETEEETAKREILEETNLNVDFVKGFKEKIEYTIPNKKVRKEVVFFLARTKNKEVQIQKEEILNYKWLNYEEALKRLTHDNAKELLEKARSYLNKIVG